MVKALIARLKEGSIKNVVLFENSASIPPPPYVVVKPEAGVRAGTRQWRIIVHHNQGMFDELSKYIFQELHELLVYDEKNGGKVFITDETGSYRLHSIGWNDVMPEPDGNTIFMERLFGQPFISGGSI